MQSLNGVVSVLRVLALADACSELQAPHLTACARLFKDVLLTPSTFPFAEAIGSWHDAAAVRGRYTGLATKKM